MIDNWPGCSIPWTKGCRLSRATIIFQVLGSFFVFLLEKSIKTEVKNNYLYTRTGATEGILLAHCSLQ